MIYKKEREQNVFYLKKKNKIIYEKKYILFIHLYSFFLSSLIYNYLKEEEEEIYYIKFCFQLLLSNAFLLKKYLFTGDNLYI